MRPSALIFSCCLLIGTSVWSNADPKPVLTYGNGVVGTLRPASLVIVTGADLPSLKGTRPEHLAAGSPRSSIAAC